MPDVGMLTPGADLAPGSAAAGTDDLAVLRAMLRVEGAWLLAQADAHLLDGDLADRMVAVLDDLAADDAAALALATDVARDAAGGGNPVIPLLTRIRAALAAAGLPQTTPAGAGLHAGLTSQDVLDTALMLVLRDVTTTALADLDRAMAGIAALADRHRATSAMARTLTQPAVPTTLGARFAAWLQHLRRAGSGLSTTQPLPAAYGGAAGTLAGVAGLFGDRHRPDLVMGLLRGWAIDRLALTGLEPGPWHVVRGPVVAWATAAAGVCAALGTIAADVLIGVRPEIGELDEPAAPGRGGSSAMAHKRNPVLSVLLRRSALLTPALAAQVLTAAGQAVDERPDGAWHAEWPALQQLARHLAGSCRIGADLLTGLVVHPEAAGRNLATHLGVDPERADVGIAPSIVDRVLQDTGFAGLVTARVMPGPR